ncbi:unnamed protein product [Macrosiphum euphorbiae]|uniref:ZSWIM1/3 RNaseH-like domain-containing protein n=1 Tax=Macrosiphum euphorbiae TaxID=13131 RepID=A0AAV0WJ53_9HEMI|nr:unnamed protein product [Macrosiphum euphorbiae]
MVEDGNGESEVAALGLMTNEEKETLRWFFETFKKFNGRSEDTKFFMTDKDMTERQVIKSKSSKRDSTKFHFDCHNLYSASIMSS